MKRILISGGAGFIGSHLCERLLDEGNDVICIDIMLPALNGYDVLKHLRAGEVWTPVLMLTAKDGEYDQAEALDYGADDYLVKPFSMRELQLRIETLLRRGQKSPLVPMEIGPFRIDPARRIAFLNNTTIPLTTREYELLLFFTHHPDEVFTRDDILREVWGWTFGEASTVTVHVRRLREKIEMLFAHLKRILNSIVFLHDGCAFCAFLYFRCGTEFGHVVYAA